MTEGLGKVVPVEDVVSENEATSLPRQELLADQEGLGKSVRRWLHGIAEGETPLRTVAEKLPEAWGVVRCGDDEDVPDASKHESRQGVVNHGLVVHRKKLLRDSLGDGMKTCARASG